MYNRRDIRYSIYRCRSGDDHPEKWREIFEWVNEQKPVELDYSDFPDQWDIMIKRDGSVEFIDTERDLVVIQSVCAEMKILHRLGQEDTVNKNFNDRQLNIITIVNTARLEEKMRWEEYGSQWGVTIDQTTGQIDTRLFNVDMGQTQVTSEMITASHTTNIEDLSDETKRRIADKEAGISYDKTVDFAGEGSGWEQMTSEQAEAIKKIMGKE